MKTEITEALHAALSTSAFAGVRAALEAEADKCRIGCALLRVAGDGVTAPIDHWRNDRWQAAWPVWHNAGPARFTATWRNGEPLFRCGREELTGEALADALRDFALGETT